MKFYAAPMEGLTGFNYRKVHHQIFPGADKYYMPFVVTHPTGKYKSKELREVAPENNVGVPAVPQILSNDAENFVKCARTLHWMGYEEVNLNLGCPSPTVVPKKRGAGFLGVPDELERFFDIVFEGLANDDVQISVKSRLGLHSLEETERIFAIYEKYPISELIVHARTQKDLYKGLPHLEAFGRVAANTSHPVCFNGNIYNIEDFQQIKDRFPKVSAVMVGRGLIANPALIRQLQGGAALNKEELAAYLTALYEGYEEAYPDGRTPVGRMKENWTYLHSMFEDCKKELKKIQKSKKPEEYREAVAAMLERPLKINHDSGLVPVQRPEGEESRFGI